MLRIVAMLGLAAAAFAPAAAARADSGPVIVIPSRPGVPVVINGLDASYAVVEGDWGLSRPGHGIITIIGGSPLLPNYVYQERGAYHPRYGRPPPRGRYEVEPPANRPLPEQPESFSRSWSSSSDPEPIYDMPRRLRSPEYYRSPDLDDLPATSNESQSSDAPGPVPPRQRRKHSSNDPQSFHSPVTVPARHRHKHSSNDFQSFHSPVTVSARHRHKHPSPRGHRGPMSH